MLKEEAGIRKKSWEKEKKQNQKVHKTAIELQGGAGMIA
jgi:hypothetical protein